jgi:hypothetical protein
MMKRWKGQEKTNDSGMILTEIKELNFCVNMTAVDIDFESLLMKLKNTNWRCSIRLKKMKMGFGRL